MSRRLWLDPGFGASGDMLLGVLLGLGAPLEAVRADLAGLGVTGWTLELDTVARAGISANRALVGTEHEPQHHRAWSSIDRTLAQGTLPDPVKAGSRRTFELLARVEAAIHGIDVDDVHFHEVGALDAIIDIVGTWSALHQLAVAEVASGPVGVGNGVVSAAHGRLPAPAPATVALLEGASIRPVDWASETVTPTGAALLQAMVTRWGPVPAGQLVASARGAGGRNPDTHPNVVGALLVDDGAGEPSAEPAAGGALSAHPRTEPALVLATNLDDTTAEILGHTIARLLEAGADDAWVVPIGMKKNRPGHELRVLCKPAQADALEAVIFAETGTLGLRRELVTKQVLDRRHETVQLRGRSVRVKVGPHGSKAEHDDLVELSRATGVPVRQLGAEAAAAAQPHLAPPDTKLDHE
jgi:pyridinium-3,5-bisthiocarboxylic acid mononucleotide nickel chelatase